jgi:lipoxygenase
MCLINIHRINMLFVHANAETGKEKQTVKSYAHKVADDEIDIVTYEAEFSVPAGYGAIGAVLVGNEHGTEMLLEDLKVVTAGDSAAPLVIRCDSWLPPKSGDAKRVFFANKVIGSRRINLEDLMNTICI